MSNNMNNEIENALDSPMGVQDKELFALIVWWEKKRMPYNLVMTMAGIYPFVIGMQDVGLLWAVIFSVCYAIAANAAYTLLKQHCLPQDFLFLFCSPF
jgi:hypothetical protein